MLVYGYVAGEVSYVVVEKVKELELTSRRAQLFLIEIIIKLGHSHASSRLPVKKSRRLLHKRRKVRYLYGRVSGKISVSLTIPLHSQLLHNHDAGLPLP